MKVLSVNFVNQSDLPQRTRDTEGNKVVAEIAEAVKKLTQGKALSLKLQGIKKWHRYAIQKKLQKSGLKVKVTQTSPDTIAIFRVS